MWGLTIDNRGERPVGLKAVGAVDTRVKRYPAVPHVDDAPPALLEEGHLWVQELLDGAHLRFQLRDTGEIRFGDRDRTWRGDDVPLAYEHAVEHVRTELDRGALRAAVDDVDSVVFFGEAMHRQGIDYDWHRTPSVLGFDVWDADREQFLPPDAVERVFMRLGLEPINTFRKEVRASDFGANADEVPESAWRDGPAAGLFVRNKTGGRATVPNPDVEWDAPVEPLDGTPEALAARLATDDRFRRAAADLESGDRPVTHERLFERVFREILRATHQRLEHGRTDVDPAALRSAVAARAQAWLAGSRYA